MKEKFHGGNLERQGLLGLGVDGKPLRPAFRDGSFVEPFLRVEANLIRMEQDKLVLEELSDLSVSFANYTLSGSALLQLYIHHSSLARVEVAVNVQILLIYAHELLLVRLDIPCARCMDGEKAGLLVVSPFLTET